MAAAKLGIPNPVLPLRFWTPEEEKLLGTAPDVEIARQLNRTVLGVATRRRELGLQFRHTLVRPWTKADLKLLGTAPDQEIAGRLGRSATAVAGQRLKHGIH